METPFVNMQTMPVQIGSLFLLDFSGGLIRKVVGFVIGQDSHGDICSLPVIESGLVYDEDEVVLSQLNYGSNYYDDLKRAWIDCWRDGNGSDDEFLAYCKKVGLPIIHGMKSQL